MDVQKTVLIVDDAPDIREIGELLLKRDFDVIGTASDGYEALRVVRTEKPDLIVLDYGMPDLDGKDIGLWIRAESPDSKVLVFSGMPEAEATMDLDWADAFLRKTEIARLPEIARRLVDAR